MTPRYVNQGGELNWLLDDLVNRVPQVTKMSGTAAAPAPMAPPSMPLLPLAPQPRGMPSATSVYTPHPTPTGHPRPAPYTE